MNQPESKPTEAKEIISKLKELENPKKTIYKEKKFGIIANNSLGIYHSDLNKLAKEIGINSKFAFELFETGIYEARLLCSKIFNPKDLTSLLMENWVRTFENWEICDSFCMGLFAKSNLAVSKAIEWSSREKEFEKRAAFAIIAAYCMADKKAPNSTFEQFLPIIKREAIDERNFVKKAVNWSLRNIGKRNVDLNQKAVETAKEILQLDSKSASWIAKNALKELSKENLNILDYPRNIYRPA